MGILMNICRLMGLLSQDYCCSGHKRFLDKVDKSMVCSPNEFWNGILEGLCKDERSLCFSLGPCLESAPPFSPECVEGATTLTCS